MGSTASQEDWALAQRIELWRTLDKVLCTLNSKPCPHPSHPRALFSPTHTHSNGKATLE